MTSKYLKVTFSFVQKDDSDIPWETTAEFGEKIRDIARKSGIKDDYKLYEYGKVCPHPRLILDDHIILENIHLVATPRDNPYGDCNIL